MKWVSNRDEEGLIITKSDAPKEKGGEGFLEGGGLIELSQCVPACSCR